MWYAHIRDLFPTAEGCMGGRLPNVTLLHWAKQPRWCKAVIVVVVCLLLLLLLLLLENITDCNQRSDNCAPRHRDTRDSLVPSTLCAQSAGLPKPTVLKTGRGAQCTRMTLGAILHSQIGCSGPHDHPWITIRQDVNLGVQQRRIQGTGLRRQRR